MCPGAGYEVDVFAAAASFPVRFAPVGGLTQISSDLYSLSDTYYVYIRYPRSLHRYQAGACLD